MAFAVWGVRDSLLLALTVGVLTWGATLAAAWRLLPRFAAEFLGGRALLVSSGPGDGEERP
jgi:hypothetical protein